MKRSDTQLCAISHAQSLTSYTALQYCPLITRARTEVGHDKLILFFIFFYLAFSCSLVMLGCKFGLFGRGTRNQSKCFGTAPTPARLAGSLRNIVSGRLAFRGAVAGAGIEGSELCRCISGGLCLGTSHRRGDGSFITPIHRRRAVFAPARRRVGHTSERVCGGPAYPAFGRR